MSIKKITIAGIAGGVIYFLLGWLVYGMLLKDFYAKNMNDTIMRPEADMIWWAMIVSNILYGVFFAYIFNRWANISTFMAGATAGGVLSLIFGLSMSLNFYAFSTMYGTMTGMAVDVIVNVVMGAIVGGVVGLVLGKVKD